MDRVLVLGAGHSAPMLIRELLQQAELHGWEIVVADRDEALARRRIDGHPRGRARFVDARDAEMLTELIRPARVVVNFLAPSFQFPVAKLCVAIGRHMVSASYLDDRVRGLDADAKQRGVTVLTEIGLDPGMDHMSAIRLLDRIRADGGRITSFASYGSGVVAPEDVDNPFGYAVTWNPRNIVMAGEAGAQYMRDGAVRVVPYPEVFRRTWSVDVPGIGPMEAYANRNALGYRDVYGLTGARTLVRATLRYPGFAQTWYHLARLGLPNERIAIPALGQRTFAELTEMFLPPGEGALELRLARWLGVSPGGKLLENFRWLGLLDDRRIDTLGDPGTTAAGALALLFEDRLRLAPNGKDIVVLHHEVEAELPGNRPRRYRSTLVHRGEPGGATAMAQTVGLPAAAATRLMMKGVFPKTGAIIPTAADVYPPLLDALAEYGLTFDEAAEG